MKLLDKLKNTFFEEEYIEVEEPVKPKSVAKKIEPKEIKKEPKEIKKEPKEIKKEPKKEVKKEPVKEDVEELLDEVEATINYSDAELMRKDSKVPYFEDEDFIEIDLNKEEPKEPKKLYGGSVEQIYSPINYSNTSTAKPYSAPAKETFRPTPIISPIYGILDKNYRKEEVIDKKDKPSSYVSKKDADLDSVRRKAYGGAEPSENSKKTISDNEVEDNLLYDVMEVNGKPAVDAVTLADAEEYFDDLGLEYNIDYKDNHYEKATGRRTGSTRSRSKEDRNLEEDSSNLEDNLFDLIDSMYEEE